MAGLFHDFLLVSKKKHKYKDYMDLINSKNALRIHDDLIIYMLDSLKFIPCHLPRDDNNKLKKCKGLNLYGPTIIRKDGAVLAEKIFQSWAALFSFGSKHLRLRGNFTGTEEIIMVDGLEKRVFTDGHYSVIKVNKDVLVNTLKTLSLYCSEVINSNNSLYILHLGI